MKYHFSIHIDSDGLWAQCIELPECKTQGDSWEVLKAACYEALHVFLEEPAESRVVFPLPDESLDGAPDTLSVAVDPEVALAVLLRFYRTNSHLTQKQAATLLGMKNVYSYQRLEKKSNPTLSLITKLPKVFPNFPLDYLFS